MDKRKAESADSLIALGVQKVKGTNTRWRQVVLDKSDPVIADRYNGAVFVEVKIDMVTAAARMPDRICRQLPEQQLHIARIIPRDSHALQKAKRSSPQVGYILHRFRQIKRQR